MIETRIITGLLRPGPDGPARLDPQRLAGDLWWTFALMRALAGMDDFDLVTLGLPVTAGLVPTAKQMLFFADRLYKEDVVGKALALQRLARDAASGGERHSAVAQAAKRLEIREQYQRMGLGVIYRLHAHHEGIDEHIVDRLQGSPRLLARLARDLANVWGAKDKALRLFPQSLRPAVAEALRQELESRSWWQRLSSWVRLVLTRLGGLLGLP